MPRKFRFLSDENIRAEVIEFLRRTHDVMSVPKGIKNGEDIRLAQKEDRILLTRDRDFANPLTYNPALYAGIVWLKIHPPSVAAMREALSRLLASLSPEKMRGSLIILERDQFLKRTSV